VIELAVAAGCEAIVAHNYPTKGVTRFLRESEKRAFGSWERSQIARSMVVLPPDPHKIILTGGVDLSDLE
jgi:hypothetical protein